MNTHFTEEETLAEALEWNRQCQPPEKESLIIHTVRDCYERWDRYEPGNNQEKYHA